MHEQAARRADSAKLASNRRAAFGTNGRGVNARGVLTPFVHDEEEPEGTRGSNDSHVDAEPIPGFGTAAGRMPAVRILGELAAPVGAPRTRHHHRGPGLDPAGHPDRHRRRCATVTNSVLGDGPHGPVASGGDGTNDFDFYSVDVAAGETLAADTEGSADRHRHDPGRLGRRRQPLAADDDSGTGVLSSLSFTPETPGTYYVMVGGYAFDPLPADPFDSGSGAGGADTGSLPRLHREPGPRHRLLLGAPAPG